MIQYGMRCHDICPAGAMTDVLDTVRANGIHIIHLAMSKSFSDYDFSVGHYSAGLANHIREELKKRDIHVAILGCYINPAHPDEEKRKAEVARFIEHLKYAKQIGADMVGTETGRFSADFSVTEKTNTEECYERVLGTFKEVVHAAEQIGVTVGVEGVFNHTLHSPELMKRFLYDIDSSAVDVIFDAVNMITPEADTPGKQTEIMDKAFAWYGNRISVLHLKDFVFEGRDQKYRHPGDGNFYYPALMKHVKKEKPMIMGLLENSTTERFQGDCEYLQKQFDMA